PAGPWLPWGSWPRTWDPRSGCTPWRGGRPTGWGTSRPQRCRPAERWPQPPGCSCLYRRSGRSCRRCTTSCPGRIRADPCFTLPLEHDPLRPLDVGLQGLTVPLLDLDVARVPTGGSLPGRNGTVEHVVSPRL